MDKDGGERWNGNGGGQLICMMPLLLADREMIDPLHFFPRLGFRPRRAEGGMLGQEDTYYLFVEFGGASFITLIIEEYWRCSFMISDALAETSQRVKTLPPSTTALINEYTTKETTVGILQVPKPNDTERKKTKRIHK